MRIFFFFVLAFIFLSATRSIGLLLFLIFLHLLFIFGLFFVSSLRKFQAHVPVRLLLLLLVFFLFLLLSISFYASSPFCSPPIPKTPLLG